MINATSKELKDYYQKVNELKNLTESVSIDAECRHESLGYAWPKTEEGKDAVYDARLVFFRLYGKAQDLILALDDVLYAIKDVLRAEERLQALPPDDDEDDSSKKGGTK